jgi:hypothetical protein
VNTAPLVDFPQLRTAPKDVVRGLREVDPTAELVYLEKGRWLLGSVRWNRDLVAAARRILGRALKVAHNSTKHGPTHQIEHLPRVRGRVQFALLAMQGFRPITEYKIQGSPDSRVVEDFRRRDWLFKNTSDLEHEAMLSSESEERKREARADLTDSERARDAWKWMFTRSHLVTRLDDPAKQRGSGRSGYTLQRRVS